MAAPATYMAQNSMPGITLAFQNQAFNAYIKNYLSVLNSEEGGLALCRVGLTLVGLIINKSPVDTGRSRAGWFMAAQQLARRVGSRSSYRLGSPEEQYGYSKGKCEIKISGLSKRITFSNAVYYVHKLEYGWSKQAPYGMVRVSMQEIVGEFHPTIYASLYAMWTGENSAIGATWRAAKGGPTTSFFRQVGAKINRSTLMRANRRSVSGVRRRSH